MTQNDTSVQIESDTVKSIIYYFYSTYNSTLFQVLYTKTTVEKIDITTDLISKSVLKSQKKTSKEKLWKLGEGTGKHELEKGKAIERRKYSYNKIKRTEEHGMEKVKMRKTKKRHVSKIKGNEKHTIAKKKEGSSKNSLQNMQTRLNSCRESRKI